MERIENEIVISENENNHIDFLAVLTEEYKLDGLNVETAVEQFAHVEDNNVGTILKKQNNSKKIAFGMVVYASKEHYVDDKEANQGVHLWNLLGYDRVAQEKYMIDTLRFFELLFTHKYRLSVDQITMGHEHGEKNGKCHLQIIVELKEETQKNIYPGTYKWDNFTYLFMAQKAKNPFALKQYCKKENDVWYLFPEKAIKFVYKKDKNGDLLIPKKVDAWATVYANPQMSAQEKQDLICTHEPRTGITMYKNIEYALAKLTEERIPDFSFVFPEWIRDIPRYAMIQKWYYKYCLPEDMDRRKALVIYGHRGCGKSRLSESLVNHPSYYVQFAGNFNNACLLGKTPKLLLLDDINHYSEHNKEAWKRLLVGQNTNINDKYTNCHWPYKVPCVLVTNNKTLLTNMMLEDEFRTQCMFFCVNRTEYIGPPGTQPEEIDTFEADITDEIREFLEFKKEKRQNHFQSQESGESRPNFFSHSRKIRELEAENEKLREQINRLKNITI